MPKWHIWGWHTLTPCNAEGQVWKGRDKQNSRKAGGWDMCGRQREADISLQSAYTEMSGQGTEGVEQIHFPLPGLLNVTRGSGRWEQRLIWSLAASSGTYKEEMVGWHHWLNGHEFGQTPGVSEGQGSLVCGSPWGCKELDSTEWQQQQLLAIASREVGL